MAHLDNVRKSAKIAVSVMVSLFIIVVFTLIMLMPTRQITPWDIRAFAVILLSLLALIAVSILMVRNATVVNSGFLIRLRDTMAATGKSFDKLENEYRQRTNTEHDMNKNLNKVADELASLNTLISQNDANNTRSI